MTIVAMLARDLAALGAETLKAVAVSDWQAVERLEVVRLDLLGQLNELAREEARRSQVLDTLYAAQAMGAQVSAAIEVRRAAENAASAQTERSIRAGRAYSSVKSA